MKTQEPVSSWFEEAFPIVPYKRGKSPGAQQMLILIGYDISNPKRLSQVAKTCEDFGLRVQYSFFECHLQESQFERLWSKLIGIIDEKEDRLVAYRLDSRTMKNTRTAGTMVCSERVICYLI